MYGGNVKFSKDTLVIHNTLKIADESLFTYPDTAYAYYKEALNVSINVKSKKHEAYSLMKIGVYLDMKGNYKEALKYYFNAKTIYESISDENGITTSYLNIANSFSYLNSLDTSIEYYLKALEIFNKNKDKEGIANVNMGIGNLNYDQKNYTNAHKYYLKAFETYRELNDKKGILDCYINLGNAIGDQGNLDKAIIYYNKSIVLAKEINHMEALAINYLNMGDCYLLKEDFDKALKYANKSLEVAKKYNFSPLYNIIYSNISEVYLNLKDYKNTIKYAKKSLEFNEDIFWAFGEFSNYSFLSEAYVGLGDYKKAYENQKLFKKYSDSIYTSEKFEKVANLDTNFEIENQKKRIALLNENETIRKVELKNQKIISIILVLFILTFLVLIILLKKQSNARKKAYSLLSIQKEKAIESDQLKSSFLANMSHEIRTPMSAIMGFSSFLKDPELTDEKRDRFVDVINHSGERLMTIINDIIDISKIESNQLKVDIENVNVVKTLKEIIEIQKETNTILSTKNVNLKLNLPTTNNVFIKTDENRFTQIINNLINNASKFTENGFIEVGYVLNYYRDTSYVQFYVKDTGCGISEDKFEAIFNRFSQAGDKDFKTGNGLGLSICKGLMLKLGGEIWLKSKVGSGTTFYFTLPY
ncbi:tetratricopeptide repeat-containing sensor histidine kinase [Lutibacter sp.]|uniref:tetratricopeptide repeat-containing sensor histidine kinase n=1 Tax=Lutibacter sp. TaxID=1925666 RepID=UPI0025BC4974|nr:tetratricopeptide repeat-containing sensor histidine kinase [Lutibacter sp.]